MNGNTIRAMLRNCASIATALVISIVSFSSDANATTIVNLTTAGSSGTINGAIYRQINPQTTGTGVFDTFVQQSPPGSGTASRAYNTTANNVLDNKNSNNFNKSIFLGDVPIVVRSGTPYRAFALDINEAPGGAGNFLSLDEVAIFAGGTANSNVTSFTAGLLNHSGILVYRMDAGMDNWVAMNYSLNSGSGSGDMLLLVPNSAFAGFAVGDVVTLYSQFGLQGVLAAGNSAGVPAGDYGASGGFEEWGTGVIPEPATCSMLALSLGGLALRRKF